MVSVYKACVGNIFICRAGFGCAESSNRNGMVIKHEQVGSDGRYLAFFLVHGVALRRSHGRGDTGGR